MALARTIYGIEYVPKPEEPSSPVLRWVLVAVVVLAAVSLTCTLVRRWRTSEEEKVLEQVPHVQKTPEAPPTPVVKSVDVPVAEEDPSLARRPAGLRTLLMRLEAAERSRDLEMAVTTIERIRALPGSPAADLDNALAHRLGTLNLKWLMERKNRQWITEMTVKSGASAARIAREHGSTLASLMHLNGLKSSELRAGTKLFVMNHPRFNFVVRRRAQTADLLLNGKFFKRYDLSSPVTGKVGPYETTLPMRAFWNSLGLKFRAGDQEELELLLPAGSPVLISEM